MKVHSKGNLVWLHLEFHGTHETEIGGCSISNSANYKLVLNLLCGERIKHKDQTDVTECCWTNSPGPMTRELPFS